MIIQNSPFFVGDLSPHSSLRCILLAIGVVFVVGFSAPYPLVLGTQASTFELIMWAVGCFAAPIFVPKIYHRLTAKLDAGDTHD